MLPPHITTAADLVTTADATVQGFIEQAELKGIKAFDMLEGASRLDDALRTVRTEEDLRVLLRDSTLRDTLLTAAGLSDKAKTHLTVEQQDKVKDTIFLKNFTQDPDHFAEEMHHRFLLIRGDTLGGMMRNLIGAVASRKVADRIVRTLSENNAHPTVGFSDDTEEKVSYVYWDHRVLLFDVTPKFIKKNVDVILLDVTHTNVIAKNLAHEPDHYLACGEIKGGIDPAGADEHWKTAKTALDRIRERFVLLKKPVPGLFFIGAAIEDSMGEEIFADLDNGRLSCAANLTKPEQLQDCVTWLVGL